MRPMKMREKVHNKVISMTQIAMDDILQPNTEYQSGERTVSSGYYDEYGNRFDLYLKLKVKAGNDNTPDELDPDSENILEDLVANVNALMAKEDKDTVYDDTDLNTRINRLEVHQHDDIADIIDILHLMNPQYLFFRISTEIGARLGGVSISYNGEPIPYELSNAYGFIILDTTNITESVNGIYTLSKQGYVTQNWVFDSEKEGNVIPDNRFCEVTMKQL